MIGKYGIRIDQKMEVVVGNRGLKFLLRWKVPEELRCKVITSTLKLVSERED